MIYSIDIFQITTNVGGTDIEKKAGTAELSYVSEAVDNDFQPVSVGDISESIEIDKGVFELDNVQLELQGIAASYFNAYDDPLNEPFVAVIKDEDTVLFHGVIARESIEYDARTDVTRLEVVSWLYVFDQTAAAARSVFETKLIKPYTKDFGTKPSVGIPLTVNGQVMNDVVETGDVAVFDTTWGEWRTPILSKTVESDALRLFLVGEPEQTLLSTYAAAALDTNIEFVSNTLTSASRLVRVKITSADLWAALSELNESFGGIQEVINNSFINVAVQLSGGEQSTFRLYPGNATQTNAAGQEVAQPFDYRLGSNETDVFFRWPVSEAVGADIDANGVTIVNVTINTTVKRGTKVRILGNQIYGYSPVQRTPSLVLPDYTKTEILEGMFSLTDIGAVRFITDTFNYPTPFMAETMSRIFEFPDNLLESLRLFQNTEYSFVRLLPTEDENGLPRLTFTLTRRVEANTTDAASTAISDVEDYTEQGGDQTPRGVVVSPHILYNAPNGESRFTTRGFWYKNAATDTPSETVPPGGSDVLELKINKEPDYSGPIWASNEKGIRQDAVLKETARRFFEFYEALNRTATVKLAGTVPATVLGNYVTFNEGGLARALFVTAVRTNLRTKKTQLKGLVGEYTEFATSVVTAKISGITTYHATSSGGTELINLDGTRSNSSLGRPLTYSWVLDPAGAAIEIGTDPTLVDYELSVGTHTIDLIVSDGIDTDTARIFIFVLDQNVDTDKGFTLQPEFTQTPTLSIDGDGDVFLTVEGDDIKTLVTGGIKVEATDGLSAYTELSASPYNNPMSNVKVWEALPYGKTLFFRVTLKHAETGLDTTTVWESQVSRTITRATNALTLYLRSASPPATPTGGKFNFETGVVTVPAGWSTSIPSGTDPLYITTALANIDGTTGEDDNLTWEDPIVVAMDGVDGVDGSDGNTVAQLQVFKRSASAPATPSGGSFNFDTLLLTPPAGWSTTPLAGGDPLYSSVAIASIAGTSGTDSSIAWSTPGKVAEDGATGPAGADGADGTTGKSVFTAIVFKRAATAPSAPSGGSFNFGTNVLTPPTGWFLDVPAGADPIYGTRYVFSVVGDTGTDSAGVWATPFQIAEDGADGLDGSPGADGISTFQLQVFKRAASAPTVPSGGSYNFGTQAITPPTGWSATVPSGSDPLYSSTALASVAGTTGIDSTLTWSTPGKVAEDGATGPAGADGADGATGPAGPAGANWTGAWATATAYSVDDLARAANGRVYICITAHTSGASTEPGKGGSWSTYWTLFAERGPGRVAAFDVEFGRSASNPHTTLTYTSGTIRMDDGSSYSISSGSIAFSTAGTRTYVYFDPDISATQFQATTSAATASDPGVGGNRVLIGVGKGRPTANDYLFFVAQWGDSLLSEQQIQVGSLEALLAKIDVLDITLALSIASGGEISIGNNDVVIDENGITLAQGSSFPGSPVDTTVLNVGNLAIFGHTEIAGGVHSEVQIIDNFGRTGSIQDKMHLTTAGQLFIQNQRWPVGGGSSGQILEIETGDFLRWADKPKHHRTLFAQHGAKVASSNTATTLLHATSANTVGSRVLPSGYLTEGGQVHFTASGNYNGGLSHTLTMKIGAASLGSLGLTLPFVSSKIWRLDVRLAVESVVSNTANVRVHGTFEVEQSNGTFTSYRFGGVSAVGVGSANTALTFDLTSQFSGTIIAHEFALTQATLEEVY